MNINIIGMIPDDMFLKIVRSAVKAPSGHNTQPWLFAKENEGICISPDFNRSLPNADPDHRELFISLGCAAETAMIAARFYGYNPTLQINQLENSAAVVLLTSAIDNIESWIKTGMAFQRFALVATRLGLSHSYLNLPCQIPQVREMMMHDLGLAGFPQLIIRLGYSEKMHYSFRRRVHEFHFSKQ